MTKALQTSSSRKGAKKRRKSRGSIPKSTWERTGRSQPRWTSAGFDSIDSQVERLADTRLPTVQRQAIAMHIAKEQGNEHLGRVVESLSHRESGEHRGELGDGKGQTQTPRSSITELVIQRALTPDEVAENLRSTQLADDDRLQKAYDNKPAMRRGERGEAVKKVQQALVDDGFKMPGSTKKSGELDEIFGSETRATVKAFQQKYLLDDDGVAGRQTLGKMDELYAGPSPLIPEDRKPEIEATEEEIGEYVTTGMDKANLGPHTADSGIHYAHNYRQNHPDLWKEDYDYGFANPAYFERIGFMDWRLKAGVSASQGIKAWLKGLTIAECLSAIYAIKSDAVRAALGDTKFDKIYGGTTKLVPKKKRLRISADPETASVDKLLKETEATEKGEIGTFGNRPAKKGEWYYFYNHPKYLLKHPGGAFQGENALYMGLEGGEQIWSGLGIDRVTELGMLEEMVKAYNLARGEDDTKELARITAENGGTLPEKYNPASGIFPDQLSDAGEILSAPEYEIDDTKRKGGFVTDSGYKLDIEKIKAMK